MTVPAEFSREFAAFPAVLRELVEAELAAGNSITEITSGFPAPPAGACLKLAQNLTSRVRKSGGGIHFYERNNSSYLGEITDAKRHFFVLEPPGPPEPEPDMDAIRAERQARYAASMAELINTPCAPPQPTPREPWLSTRPPQPAGVVDKFCASMEMNYDRWKEGTSYDLETLATCTAEERAAIESILTSGPVKDWRDVEALATLHTPRAHSRLCEVMQGRDHRLTMAVLNYAPELISAEKRTSALVAALESSEIFTGLTQALDAVEEFHPPEIMAALFRGARSGPGERSVHFAAMLMFLHGKAESAFDWEQRPFFLRFHATDPQERATVFRELCEKIGVPVPP